jgi:UDP-glucose 4-epimerase
LGILPYVTDEPLPSLRGVRVLVTGATGFIGRWVVQALAALDADVAVAVRAPSRLATIGPIAWPTDRVFTVDCAVPGELAQAISAWSPAVVFHLAGYGVAKDERDPTLMARLNTDVLAELVDALARCPQPSWRGQRLVHAGSAFEYGALTSPLDEAAEAKPTTPYGCSKLEGTKLLQREAQVRGVAAVVARLFTVFGPGERDGRLFPTLLAASSHQDSLAFSSGEQVRDFTLVWDVADALVALSRLPAEASLTDREPLDVGIVNLASGRLHSVRAFIEAAASALAIPHDRLDFGKIPQMAEDVAMLPVPVARLQSAGATRVSGDLSEMFGRVRKWLKQSNNDES